MTLVRKLTTAKGYRAQIERQHPEDPTSSFIYTVSYADGSGIERDWAPTERSALRKARELLRGLYSFNEIMGLQRDYLTGKWTDWQEDGNG